MNNNYDQTPTLLPNQTSNIAGFFQKLVTIIINKWSDKVVDNFSDGILIHDKIF